MQETQGQDGLRLVAAQAGYDYMLHMRRALLLLSALALASCAPPGRQTFAPNPAGADTQAISAADAFKGRIPLVSILPDTQDFQAPLQNAVRQALAIKPDAAFEVRAEAPPPARRMPMPRPSPLSRRKPRR